MMRILYVYDVIAQYGGVERVIVDKMNAFSNMENMEVHLITTNQGQHVIPYKLDNKVHYEDIGVQTHLQYRYHGFRRLWERYRRTKMLRQRMSEKIHEIQPDVIICTTSRLVTTMIKLKGRTPLIVESHSDFENVLELDTNSWWTKLLTQKRFYDLKKATAIVTLTDKDAEAWRRIHNNVYVIPNVVHLNETSQYSSNNKCHAIFMGRYCEQKDIPILLDIWTLVHHRHPDWILDMYGEGELNEWLRNEVSMRNIGVVVHEPTNDVFSCYCNSSMMLLSSIWEPFGLVLPEAMSCGLPVVSFSGLKGPDSIIIHGHNGYLAKNRSVEEFASYVCKLIEDSELCHEMGQHAISSSQRYASKHIMPLWLDLFKAVTDR